MKGRRRFTTGANWEMHTWYQSKYLTLTSETKSVA